MINKILDRKFKVFIFLILLIAAFFRFANYQDRWGLAYDQAHDAIIARYALAEKQIPLVGPFSSAGPFQTGGEWYWFIMLGTSLFPYLVISPWIFMSLIYILFVFLIIKIGEKFVDKIFGLTAGLLSAVSTAQIAQSTNLTNQGPEAIIALGAIWAAVSYIKERKTIYIFLLGLLISLGVSIHLQATALYSLILFTFIFTGFPKIKSLIAHISGIFIPFIPILIFDLQNNFINTRNMVQYFLHDQYRIPLEALERRWLTYALNFWPAAWGHIIGGSTILGYAIILGLILSIIYGILYKKLDKLILFLIVSFAAMVFILRYIRTPLYDSYLVFLNPFVILLSAWVIYFVYRRKKILGLAVLGVILLGSVMKDFKEISYPGNTQAVRMAIQMSKILNEKYRNEKFAFYDHDYKQVNKSLPLVLFMDVAQKIDNGGRNIGIKLVEQDDRSNNMFASRIIGSVDGHQLIDLSSSTSAQLQYAKWHPVNPSYIYNNTENWVNK